MFDSEVYAWLKDKPEFYKRCPHCHATPFVSLMRGQVQSTWRRWLRKPYCAVICIWCHEIVGHELTPKEVRAYAAAHRQIKEGDLREHPY